MNENLDSQNRRTCWATPTSAAASEMVRKASGPLVTSPRPVSRQRAVDPGLHHLRGAKADHAARLDRGRFARLGIAALAGALGADLEHAEAGQLDRLAALERLGDQIEGPLDQTGAVLAGQSDLVMDRLTEVRARE